MLGSLPEFIKGYIGPLKKSSGIPFSISTYLVNLSFSLLFPITVVCLQDDHGDLTLNFVDLSLGVTKCHL